MREIIQSAVISDLCWHAVDWLVSEEPLPNFLAKGGSSRGVADGMTDLEGK